MRRRNRYIAIDDGYRIELYYPNSTEIIGYAEISKEDYEKCTKVYWRKTSFGYARGRVNGREVLLHKYITETDDNTILDHIDRNKLNCRRENLRVADKALNTYNRNAPSNSSTGYTGVSFDRRKKKYRAYTKQYGRQIFFGYYDKLENAVEARKRGLEKIGVTV